MKEVVNMMDIYTLVKGLSNSQADTEGFNKILREFALSRLESCNSSVFDLTEELRELQRQTHEANQALMNSLNDEQKKLYQEFDFISAQFWAQTEEGGYMLGLKDGLMMAEAMQRIKARTEG